MLSEREEEKRIDKRAPELCNIEQQIRNEGRRWPAHECPRHGCRSCRLSAMMEIAAEKTREEIRACFRPAGRTALSDQGERNGHG